MTPRRPPDHAALRDTTQPVQQLRGGHKGCAVAPPRNLRTMPWLWCATFVGWGVKSLVIRYGGMKTYRAWIPFFIGLIIGPVVLVTTGSLLKIFARPDLADGPL